LTIFEKAIDPETIFDAIITSRSSSTTFESRAKLSEAILNPTIKTSGICNTILRPKTQFFERSCSLFLAKFDFHPFGVLSSGNSQFRRQKRFTPGHFPSEVWRKIVTASNLRELPD
jgi:hypothetical protein